MGSGVSMDGPAGRNDIGSARFAGAFCGMWDSLLVTGVEFILFEFSFLGRMQFVSFSSASVCDEYSLWNDGGVVTILHLCG